MEIALAESGIPFVAKPRLPVFFRGRKLRRQAEPDLLVGDHIVLELKTADKIHPRHEAQVLAYLRVTKRPLGFVVNFSAAKLGEGIRRKVLS